MKKFIKILVVVSLIASLMWPILASAQDAITPPAADPESTAQDDKEKEAETANSTSEQWVCPAESELATMPECISETERTDFIITVQEEAMGKENFDSEKGGIKECTRVTVTDECSKGDKNEYKTLTKLIRGNKCPSGYQACDRVTVLFAKSGVGVVEMYIAQIYRWAASIAGIVCILIMIVSGIQISAAGEDTQAVESAKKRIIQSILGLVVLFMSAAILYIVNPGFFGL